MTTPDGLAGLIQGVMAERDWTFDTVARRSGLSLSTVHAWATGARATGTRGPDPEKLRQLARGLGGPVGDVFVAAGRRASEAMDPGEGYIAPTELLPHDGSTHDSAEPSTTAFWLGHWTAGRLPWLA